MLQTKIEIREWLNTMNINNYIIHDDLVVDVRESVNLNNKNLSCFPIKFGTITGSFSCSSNVLQTLKNGPQNVKGFFDCSFNELASLEYCPKKIKTHFNCSYNQLKSLKACPKKINGHFNCSGNQLVDLKFAPTQVKEDFTCFFNDIDIFPYLKLNIDGNLECHHNKHQIIEHFINYYEDDSFIINFSLLKKYAQDSLIKKQFESKLQRELNINKQATKKLKL